MGENFNQNEQNELVVKPLSWWERLKYIFISPSKTFENLKHYPKILFPMLVILIGVLLLSLPTIDMMKVTMKKAALEQYARMGIEMPAGFDALMDVQVYTTIIVSVIAIAAIWIIKSALINAFSGFVNGTGTFKQAFSVIAYSYFPVLLGTIIRTVLVLITKESNIMTSLAVFLPNSQANTFIYLLLSNLEIFVIWYQVLAIIGVSKVYGISKKSSSILVLGTWIVFILITSGLGAVGTKLAGF